MTAVRYTPINYAKFQRVTHDEMNYIQTQYRKAERLRIVDTLPTTASSTAGDVVFLSTDKNFYGFDGTSWGSIGDVELPIADNLTLLKNSANAAKAARFDLSLLSTGSAKVYYLPDGGGILATMSDVPVVTGDTEGAVLYLGTSVIDIQSNSDVLIARDDSDPYIEINKSVAHTGDIIKYNTSINNPKFVVENDGRTIVKKLTVFSGRDG
jgi:hypothetical protein